ncbi:Alpha subunit of the F1 sector of mitochondrial F1F0 ATP synthase [Dionaea muscipula]
MAATILPFSCCPAPLSPPPCSTHQAHQPLNLRARTGRRVIRATGLGDFGARDPFPAELESNFGEKVVGNMNTEHKILIPNASALCLSQLECSPIPHLQPPMPMDEAKLLLFKIVGWRLLDEEEGLKLQCVWKLRDFKCSIDLLNRIAKVAEEAGHFPSLYLEQPCQVRAELWTPSIGGLSMNDFVVAAKIDKIKISDLVPRKRIWA